MRPGGAFRTLASRERLPYTGSVGACRKCGEVNPPHAVFCLACGVRLQFGDLRPDSRKPVTILFNDVVESTALGERSSPRRSAASGALLATVTQSGAPRRHGREVHRRRGDGGLRVPAVHEDDALRAVGPPSRSRGARRAERGARRAVRPRLQTRIGVNSGEVVAGDPGRAGARHGRRGQHGEATRGGGRAGEILIGDATRALVEAQSRPGPSSRSG